MRARAGRGTEAVLWTDVLLLAVHWSRVNDVLKQVGNISGKVLITCSMPMSASDTCSPQLDPRHDDMFSAPTHSRLDHPAVSEWSSLDAAYRFLIHDRDAIFAHAVDEALPSMSLQALRTPVCAPQANAHCERFLGTARRECLDW